MLGMESQQNRGMQVIEKGMWMRRVQSLGRHLLSFREFAIDREDESQQ